MVTGGGRGIGRAIAIALAKSGASLAVVARTESEIIETCSIIKDGGGTALPICADVTKPDQVCAAMESVSSLGGRLDLLVNNAGSGRSIGPMWEVDPDIWWRDFEINVRGVFLCMRAVLPAMIERRRGRIINISSAAGNVTLPMTTSYSCSKAAVQRLSDSAAVSVRAHGISVFAVSPGPTRTQMTEHILTSAEGRKWMPEFQSIPLDQWTDPEKIGDFVVRLANGDADALSGRFLHVRQDLSELVRRTEEIEKLDLYTLRLRQ
jgi:NAD(P)-dependent dehydrogenase (short-subunit alcohol dehydrogenase family)